MLEASSSGDRKDSSKSVRDVKRVRARGWEALSLSVKLEGPGAVGGCDVAWLNIVGGREDEEVVIAEAFH